MIEQGILEKFSAQFNNLEKVVEQSKLRVISEPIDQLFYENQNVFIKSYLVSACSMLEAYIQELLQFYVDAIQDRINSANVPYNFVVWLAEFDKAKMHFGKFEGNKKKKDVSDLVSPNFYKTIQAFERIGVDISQNELYSFKDYITSIVNKRNRIVHHNDDASDLSFSDIVLAIHEFKLYCECLHKVVTKDKHLQL